MTGTKKDLKALLIGNGPSQGFIDKEELNNFVKSGGETICVKIIGIKTNKFPTYTHMVIFSDPLSFDIK